MSIRTRAAGALIYISGTGLCSVDWTHRQAASGCLLRSRCGFCTVVWESLWQFLHPWFRRVLRRQWGLSACCTSAPVTCKKGLELEMPRSVKNWFLSSLIFRDLETLHKISIFILRFPPCHLRIFIYRLDSLLAIFSFAMVSLLNAFAWLFQ